MISLGLVQLRAISGPTYWFYPRERATLGASGPQLDPGGGCAGHDGKSIIEIDKRFPYNPAALIMGEAAVPLQVMKRCQ